MDVLPPELIYHITNYLDLTDCYHLKQVSHRFYDVLTGFDDVLQYRYLLSTPIHKPGEAWKRLRGCDRGREYLKKHCPEWYGCMIFNYYCGEGDLSSVEELLANPKFYEKWKGDLETAARRGHAHIVKRLLQEPKIDPMRSHGHPFAYACHNGHLEVVEILLNDDRVDPTDDNDYALLLACEAGQLEIVNRLLEDPRILTEMEGGVVKVNSIGRNIINKAFINEHKKIVARLLKDPRIIGVLEDRRRVKYVKYITSD